MEIRRMNKLGLDMPLLGMGLMRLPMNGSVVEDNEAMRMVDTMYNAGVRYFDTAYVYMNGESEKFARRALVERYPRESFCLATKLPIDDVHTPEDNERIFNTSCERMGVDYVDFYLLHALNEKKWRRAVEMGSDKYQRRLKEEGKVRFVGFSFHGSPQELLAILNDQPDWDFIQIQLNYYDWYADCAKELYNILAERNIPIIVMEPVRGGGLVELGDDIRDMLACAREDSTNAQWAMRWVGSLPAVNVVLSGVSTIEQAEENAKVYAPLEKLSEAEEAVIKSVVDTIHARPYIPCTGCNYCEGCPAEIPIPGIFRASNAYTRMYNKRHAMWFYYTRTKEENRADACKKCGRCVKKCPQGIDIPAELEKCHQLMQSLHEE